MTRSITITNNAGNGMSFAIFQIPSGPSSIMSLAWHVVRIAPNSKARVMWEDAYSFHWAQTGKLSFGVRFDTAQAVPCSIPNRNEIPLQFSNGYISFGDPTSSPQSGYEFVITPQVQMDFASVGLGINATPVCVAQANPNQMILMEPPSSTFYVMYGSFSQGEVINGDALAVSAARIDFDRMRPAVNVVLNADTTWTVSA